MSQVLHDPTMLPGTLARPSSEPFHAPSKSGEASHAARIKSVVSEHYAFLWRSLRRLGVDEADVEDAAQKCLWVMVQRIDDIVTGKEKTFLFGVALRVGKRARQEREA